MVEQDAKHLAVAVINYSAALALAQEDPAAMTSFRTAQGDDLDTLYERMLALACRVGGFDPDQLQATLAAGGWTFTRQDALTDNT